MNKNLNKLLLSVLATFTLASCNEKSVSSEQKQEESSSQKQQLAELPEPFDSTIEGASTFSVAASNITSKNFDEYAHRPDVRYIDLRDTADYTKSRLEGFEMVEFFSKIFDKAGTGTQLFTKDANGVYQPRYKDSVEILKDMLPQDQTLFLMCQSGGRVATCMQILEQFGWDMSKVYNIGGMAQYGESKYRMDFSLADLKAAAEPIHGTKATTSKKLVSDLPDPFDAAKEGASTFSLTASNIKSDNLDKYLDRSDVRYIDLRDSADYTKSRLEGFEMVEFFTSVYDKAGTGNQLFYKLGDEYVARYEDSVELLEELLPKDQTLFLMCQSGGRVSMCMQIMEQFGWDMANVYNVGGMSNYASSPIKMDYNVDGIDAATNKILKGSFTEKSYGYDYTMNAFVEVDANNKIVNVVTVGGFTANNSKWDSKKWTGDKTFLAALKGKGLSEVEALLDGEGKATTHVAGASLSSTRALKAVADALTEKKD